MGLSVCGILHLKADKLIHQSILFLGQEFALNLLAVMYDADLGAENKPKPQTGIESLISRCRGVNYVENYMPTTHLKSTVRLTCKQKFTPRILQFIKLIKIREIINKNELLCLEKVIKIFKSFVGAFRERYKRASATNEESGGMFEGD